MFIEIFTETYKDTESFVFVHDFFIDSVHDTKKTFGFIPDINLSPAPAYKEILCNPELLDLFVKAYNIGHAITHITDNDKRFGLSKKQSHLSDHLLMKTNQPKFWVEYNDGEKRQAIIYTDCEDTYKNIKLWCDINNHYLIRFYNRLMQLLAENYIKLQLTENIGL
jgi:hypothetical protein